MDGGVTLTVSVEHDDVSSDDGYSSELSVRLTRDGRVAAIACLLCPSFQLHPDALHADAAAWRALVSDCESVFTSDSSFWLPHSASPRCALEALARQIYSHHTRNLPQPSGGEAAGCEWWVQVRRGPNPAEAACRRSPRSFSADARNIRWHWDKDERLIDSDGPTVHPAVSTVTYLTGAGAPTVIVPLSPLQSAASSRAQRRRHFVNYLEKQTHQVRP